MGKRDFNQEMQARILSLSGNKPTLLLQCCCGPCSTSVIERLIDHFDITLYYYNPNTWPEEEYYKRLDTLKEYIDLAHLDVKVVAEDYNIEEYFNAIQGINDEKEGGQRCQACIGLRLRRTAEFAKKNGFSYFASTLSVSPMKNAEMINTIGENFENELDVKYLVNDFKKENGYLRSVTLSKEYNLYRQNYCGCEKSKNMEKHNG